MDLHGIGPAGAARILADVGDIARFPDRDHFASWTGTAPLDASSGEHIRHRLSRAGNRRMNHVLYVAAIAQIRHDTEGRRYYRRKLQRSQDQQGSPALPETTPVRPRLPPAPRRRHALAGGPGARQRQAGPGGHSGASDESSAADLHTPVIGSSDQPQPEPAAPTLPARRPSPTPHAASARRPPRRRAGAVKVERPTGRTTLTATSAGAHSTTPKPRP